jgi:hypothetical protein
MEHINITSGATLIYGHSIKAKATNVIIIFVLFRMSLEENYDIRKIIIWSAALLIIRPIISVYYPIHCIQTNHARMLAGYVTRHSANEGQNTCSFTSTPPYTFTVSCLI